jgi:hypothetical protein
MAMKQPGQKTYKTMRGREIDMELLRKKNELVPAIGNARVNARGDQLGANGKIVRKREDIVNDYYVGTQSVPSEEPVPQPAKAEATTEAAKSESKKVADKSPRHNKGTKVDKLPGGLSDKEASEWEENDEGDFVQKGSNEK